MRAVIQRVSRARVTVEDRTVGSIDKGYMVLLVVSDTDTKEDALYLADKIAGLRVFEDEAGKLNLDIGEAGGSVLLVSQFTLYGDAKKGRRPSFIRAAKKEPATELLAVVRQALEEAGLTVETGEFGAHMSVELVNDGPVTILLASERTF